VTASRLAGLALLALVVAAGAWRIVPAFTSVADEIDGTSGLTRLERELSPAGSVDIDTRPIEAAARQIPPGATFAILVGEEYPFTHEVSGLTLPSWAAYRLLPRRRVADASAADWVISYGADLAAHNVYPQRTTGLGLGVTLARVP
jgi:hypothetical protein